MVMTRSERRRQIAIGIDQSCSTSIRGHGFAPPRKLNATASVVVSRNRNRQALCTGPISRPVMPPSSMCDARRGVTGAEMPSSDTDGDTSVESITPSDSSGSITLSSSRDEENEAEMLPARYFSADRYPRNGRVNSYSRPQYLVDILTILDGTPELELLEKSPFWSLFLLPVRRCSLSGKLLHNILCRQIVSHNPEEIWFTFGGHPLRFSLVEFGNVTGLHCGPYPDQERIDCEQTPKAGASPYWDTLVGSDTDVTIDDIVNMLKSDPGMAGWKKLRLVLIVIVEGILICGTQPIRPSFALVEMVKNLEFFYRFPWGRLAFERTLRMVKVGNRIRKQSTLIKKLKQKSLVVHGFPIALQLMLFETIPLLLRYLPCSNDAQTFCDRKLSLLPKLKTYHTENIIAVEHDAKLCVLQNLYSNPREWTVHRPSGYEGDPRVTYMLNLIHGGYSFCKLDWSGGDATLDRLCICQKSKNRPCLCGDACYSDGKVLTLEGTSTPTGFDTAKELAKLWDEVAALKKSTSASVGSLRASMLSEFNSLIDAKNCLQCTSSVDIVKTNFFPEVVTVVPTDGAQQSLPVCSAPTILPCTARSVTPLVQDTSIRHPCKRRRSNILTYKYADSSTKACNIVHMVSNKENNTEKSIVQAASVQQLEESYPINTAMREQTRLSINTPTPASYVDSAHVKLLHSLSNIISEDEVSPRKLLSEVIALQPTDSPTSCSLTEQRQILSLSGDSCYLPRQTPKADVITNFTEQLQKYQKPSYDIDGCEVPKTFFSEIYTP